MKHAQVKGNTALERLPDPVHALCSRAEPLEHLQRIPHPLPCGELSCAFSQSEHVSFH